LKALLLFLVLLGAQALLIPSRPVGGGGAILSRFPGAFGTALLAGFRPLAIELLYLDFERSYGELRSLDALADARLLQRLDPMNPRAVLYLFRVIAYDLASAAPTLRGKLTYLVEGLKLLEKAEQRLQKDPRLPRARALLLQDQVLNDPRLERLYRLRRGRDPWQEAWRGYLRTLTLAPGAAGTREAAINLVLTWSRLRWAKGHPRQALEILQRGLERARAWGRLLDPLQGGLLRAWTAVALFLQTEKEGVPTVRQLEQAVSKVPGPARGGDGVESLGIWNLVLAPGLRRAQAELHAGEASAALSLLEALHSIQALARRRLLELSGGGRVQPPTAGYEARWRAVVAELEHVLPAFRARLFRIRKPW